MRFIRQAEDYDCGTACLAMIVDHHGGSQSLARIGQLSGTDLSGTNLSGLVRAGEALGFDTRAMKGDADALLTITMLPFVAHLNLHKGDQIAPHFVVITKLTRTSITIYDPLYGILKEPMKNFLKLWTGYVVIFTPKDDFRPYRSKKGLFSRFFPVIQPQLGLLGMVALASLILTIFGIVSSFYFRFLIDDILPSRSELNLHVVSLGIVVLTIFQVLLEAVRSRLLLYFSLRVDNRIIYSYFHHVLSLPLSFFDSRRAGDILSRLSQVSEIRSALSDAALTLVMDTLMVVVIGAVLLIQSPILFAVPVVSVPMVTLCVFIFSRLFVANYKKLMSEGSDVQALLVETFNGIATVKALNAVEKVNEEFDEKQSKVIWTSYRLGMLEINQGIFIGLIQTLSNNAIFWVGSALILHNSLSLGQLISFSVLVGFFLGPLQRLVSLQPNLQKAFAAADRVGEFFDLDSEADKSPSKLTPTEIQGPIEFHDVVFRYGTRKPVLVQLNLVIPRGKQVALVGPSGSGKSTMVKLLLKFYAPESGKILVGGRNLADIDNRHLRDRIGYVPQEVFLFAGTILDNIRLGKPDTSVEQAMAAANRAGATAFIEALPERYNTVLTEKGASLSGGERQRLALARALVGNPSLIIFDEATSNLDSLSERQVLDTLKSLRNGETTIILIAHRLQTIIDSDLIYVFSEGSIGESGTHAELLEGKGHYAKLWSEGRL